MLDSLIHLYYQGAAGAFSHRAAQMFAQQEFEGQDVRFESRTSFDLVVEETINGNPRNRFGVLPLENSSIGPIVANYDALRTRVLRINRDLYLPVAHCLLAKAGVSLDEIREVHSHPVALMQCKSFFERHKEMLPVEAFDTAGAALFVSQSENPSVAAIASEDAAVQYNLEILKRGIQDYQDNCTRFALVSVDGCTPPALPMKMTVLFELRAGKQISLSELLPKGNKIEITSIVVRPVPEEGWTYAVFIDFVCEDLNDVETVHALTYSRMLGTYPPPIDYID